jgi:Ca2+-binding RTX toxin-like protein
VGVWSPGPAATPGNDTFVGDATNETADGLAGDDTLSGNGGDDTLIGGDGDDFIAGGAGDDTLAGGAGDDDLYQMAASRSFSGAVLVDGTIADWGNDIIDGGAGVDRATISFADRGAGLSADLSDPTIVSQFTVGGIFAGSVTSVERFTLTGTDFGDTITTGDGDDLIAPGLGNDSIFTGAGDDRILAGVTAANESNHFDGGAGTDSISYYAIGPSAVVIDLGNGVATVGTYQPVHDALVSIENAGGTWQNDDITGSDGANVLFGDNGDDILHGLAGNDILITDVIGGADEAYGGEGDDLYVIASAAAQVIELANEGVDTVHLEAAFAPSSTFDFSAFANVENFETTVSDSDITLVANSLNNVIRTGVANFGGPFEFYSSDPVGARTTIYAGAGDDSVFADTTHANIATFFGEDGDDELHGGPAADSLSGGAGDDTLIGGAGADTASYAASNARVSIDLLNATASGGDAQGDILTSIENLTGSAFNDALMGDNGANVFAGGDGDDVLIAAAGDDDLSGGAGNDILNGGYGADHMDGGDGVDTVSYENGFGDPVLDINLETGIAEFGVAEGDTFSSIENLIGTVGADYLTGSENVDNVLDGAKGDDSLAGLSGNDTLIGGLGRDHLTGGDGNDTLIGGADKDVLDGGNGVDTLSYEGSLGGVTVRLWNNSATGGDANALGGGAGGDTIVNFENVIGGDGSDGIIGSDDVGNVLSGGLGNDYLEGRTGDDTLIGGAGADKLLGDDGLDTASYADSIVGVIVNFSNGVATGGDAQGDTFTSIENLTGSAFSDTLTGDANFNVLMGGVGDDLLSGGAGGDTLDGGAGVDTLSYAGSTASVTIRLWNMTATAGVAQGDIISGFENVTGGNGNDGLVGSDDVGNVLIGRNGNDYLEGRGGDDILMGGAGADHMVGGEGVDTASYEGTAAAITVRLWNSTGTGGEAQGDTFSGIESVIGGVAADSLIGTDDVANTLRGGAGNDYLEGRSGDDVLIGGAGADKLVGDAGNDTFVLVAGDANGDIIADFAGNGASAGDAITFSGYGTAAAGAHVVQLDATHWQIVSADGLIHDTITLSNAAALDPGDYIFGP